MTSETKTSTFNKKILATIIIIIIVVAASVVLQQNTCSQQPSSNANLSPLTLTLVGADGQQKVLNEKDLAALESYTANGGFKSSGGLIAAVGEATRACPFLTHLQP